MLGARAASIPCSKRPRLLGFDFIFLPQTIVPAQLSAPGLRPSPWGKASRQSSPCCFSPSSSLVSLPALPRGCWKEIWESELRGAVSSAGGQS